MSKPHILRKPTFLKFLGSLYYSCQAVFPVILAPTELDFNKKENQAILVHEEEHILRAKDTGIMKWYFKYVFSKNFRLEEELAATKKEFEFMRKYGIQINLNKKAKHLSSWLYLKMVSYTDGLDALNEL